MSDLKRGSEEIVNAEGKGHEEANKKAKTARPSFRVEPYLYFAGNCKQALDFYVECFDGKITMIKYFKEAPKGNEFSAEEAKADQVMHASISFGDGEEEMNMMFSDVTEKSGEHVVGTNVHLSVGMTNLARMEAIWKKFEANEKTKITMPLQKTFWGSTYGNLIDPFGVHWMFSGPASDDESKE